jgi:trehalose 6-phosphate phosphatase
MTFLPIHCEADAFAFFFDFDGTLAELADTPDAVIVESRAKYALASLAEAASGAVAIVTGREIDTIDGFLQPLQLPVAGVHGFERRDGHGRLSSVSEDRQARSIEKVLSSFANHNPGLLLEKKRGAFALHFRLRPELESLCLALVEDVAGGLPEAVLTRGKMVIEIRLHKATKGTAIEDFLNEPPFHGRTPFFAGDDVTDEDAFATVNALGGVTVKVGPGDTAAKFRVRGVDEFLSWLEATALTFSGRCQYGQS